MTIKTRITVLIVMAGLTASLLFSLVVFFELVEQPFRLLDDVLKEEAVRIVDNLCEKRNEAGTSGSTTRYRSRDATGTETRAGPKSRMTTTAALGLERYWVEVKDERSGRLLFKSRLASIVQLPPIEPGHTSIVGTTINRELIDLDQDRYQEVTFRAGCFRFTRNGTTYTVRIARPMEKLEEEIWELVLGVILGLVLSTLALAGISHFVAGKILEPIGKMSALAQSISEQSLDKRIPHGETQDEFNELARTINGMLDRLQESLERQREFLHDTSHELKTPLATIRLVSDQLLEQNIDTDDPDLTESLHRLHRQVLCMERLVKDMFNLSALDAMEAVNSERVQLASLLASLVDDYRILAEARQVHIEVNLPEQLPVAGDPDKLRRAFSNILDNAVKYNFIGGSIEVQGMVREDEATLTITNTGPSIPDSELPRLFERFYRVEKSRSAEYGGAGLGLAIVKKVIELHHGRVTLESNAEGLTRVTVTLPVHTAAPPVADSTTRVEET